MIYWKGGCVSS